MQFGKETSEIFVPDGVPAEQALARTTHLALAAHQDDIEIMAIRPILECFGRPDRWFTGVVVTDGAGSARDDLYARYTDDEMRAVRRTEQKKAAYVGEYGAAVFLDYPSAAMKKPGRGPVEDIVALLKATRPEAVFTHNLADKHATHVGVALRVVKAIRELPPEERPQTLLGAEVWRDLDWLPDEAKTLLPIEKHENIADALVAVFDSQIVGGKRYDLATTGRRRANATYFQSHAVDAAQLVTVAMDLTPLITDDTLDPAEFTAAFIDKFRSSVVVNLRTLRP